MIVNKKEASKFMCIVSVAIQCHADSCMGWKWVEKDDLGCCGLINPNLIEEYYVSKEGDHNGKQESCHRVD